MEKHKLTLSIDPEVIMKAKKLGLNLSEVTENALRLTSFEKSEDVVKKEKVVIAYQTVFKSMKPILESWQLHLPIGKLYDIENQDESTYYLTPNRVYLLGDNNDVMLGEWGLNDVNIPVDYFYESEQIIREFIDLLLKTAEHNKEKVQKLEIVANLLKLSGL
jgi:post-segregation antitoxin (ccd killing protein)